MSESLWHFLLVLAVIAIVVEGFVLVGVLREVGAVLLQLGPVRYGEVDEGPPKGTELQIDALVSGRSALILFLGPTCEFCKPVASAIPAIRSHFPSLELLPIVVGDSSTAKAEYAAGLGPNARTDLDHLFRDWGIPGTPFAVGVGIDGRVVTSGVVNNLPQLETLAGVVCQAQFGPVSGESGEPRSNSSRSALPLARLNSERSE